MTSRLPQRQVTYQWRLRELMASRGLFNAPDLEPLLAERGIHLSSVQVWRLVAQVPERLSLQILAALCDIFEVTPADLITVSVGSVQPLKAASASQAGTPDPDALRPRPARLRPSP